MSLISAMPASIAAWLAEQEVLSDIRFLTEFPASSKPVPLSCAIVTLGYTEMQITDVFAANNNGVLAQQEYCRTAALRLRITISVPYTQGGAACFDILTRVLDVLTFASDLNITESGCGDVKAHRDTDAFVLEAYARITADFCPAETTGLSLESFLPKDLLCGSHISNAAIHLSSGDRAWLNNPALSGFYVGTGTAARSVSLAAAPKAVLVWALGYPLQDIDFSSQTTKQYAGFVCETGGTLGLSLSGTALTLHSGTGYTLGNNQAALNETGRQYGYFAWL
jgi:hypothetical protein